MGTPFTDKTPIHILNTKRHTKTIRGKIYYGIDKLEIVSKVPPEILKNAIQKLRPINRDLAVDLKIKSIPQDIPKRKIKNYDEVSKKGYCSLLRVVCPTPPLFDLLLKHEKLFGAYKPWVIELYKEIVTPTPNKAVFLTDFFIDTTYKKYSEYSRLYNAKLNSSNYTSEKAYENALNFAELRKRKRNDILGNKTLYLDNRNLNYVIYSRLSKRTKEPCVHLEWRIKGYDRFLDIDIYKKNSSYLLQLKNLALLYLPQVYEDLNSKHIKYAEINKIAFSKHHQGKEYRKKFTVADKSSLQLHYNTFKRVHNIETTSDFVRYCKRYCKKHNLDLRRFLTQIDLIYK